MAFMPHMFIYFAPDFSQRNPYQRNLSNALQQQGTGIKIIGLPLGIAPLLKLLVKRVHVIHLHWPNYYYACPSFMESWYRAFCFLAILGLLKIRGTKVIWTVHNLANHDSKQRYVEAWIMQHFVKFVDHFIVHCDCTYELLHDKYNEISIPRQKTSTIPHGHYFENYTLFRSKELARSKLHLNENTFVYLFLGQIRRYKGLDQLIANFDRLFDQNAILLIVGSISDRSLGITLEKAASRNSQIIFHPGFVAGKLVPLYFAAADVLVYPYQHVLTSGAIMLAMTLGKPCIAPRMGCVAEMLGQDGGFLYDPEESQGLFNALKKASIDRELLQRMGRRNLVRAREFDWHEIARQTYGIYSN